LEVHTLRLFNGGIGHPQLKEDENSQGYIAREI
jgi:hypothetical protein